MDTLEDYLVNAFCFNELMALEKPSRATTIHSRGFRAETPEKRAHQSNGGHAVAAGVFKVVL